MLVTFATCWYELTSKFQVTTYLNWMRHMLLELDNYYLVLFTDAAGEKLLRDYFAPYYFLNPHLKIIQKPCEQWYNYKYETQWKTNHAKNSLLNSRTEWKLNMLWAEKVHFVDDARLQQYFPPTEFYGWCDIGYFREGQCPGFASTTKLRSLNKNKIYYACVNRMQFNELHATTRNEYGLPNIPIPANQTSIAGGFFIAHHSKIEGWKKKFDEKLALYFKHKYLVKDDQIIIVDCILSEPHRFEIIQDPDPKQNPWFYFRRFLNGGYHPQDPQ
jgi:hypothetical protein